MKLGEHMRIFVGDGFYFSPITIPAWASKVVLGTIETGKYPIFDSFDYAQVATDTNSLIFGVKYDNGNTVLTVTNRSPNALTITDTDNIGPMYFAIPYFVV